MKIYNYHLEYKTYTGSSLADESPLEPGVFLIPAYATQLKPPSFSENQIPVFNGTSWEIIENCCGTYYSTTSKEKIICNNPLTPPENTTKEKPPEIPEGYDLEWNDQWELKEIPVPEPLTIEQKLESIGLTIEELRSILL
jgi:hypothetical protein